MAEIARPDRAAAVSRGAAASEAAEVLLLPDAGLLITLACADALDLLFKGASSHERLRPWLCSFQGGVLQGCSNAQSST